MEFRGFYKVYRSVSGARFVMRTRSNEFLIENGPVISATIDASGNVSATTLFDPGDVAPWAPALTINTVGEQMGITSDGRAAIDTITSDGDRYVILGNNTNGYNVIAREGQPIPGMPSATWGVILDEVSTTGDGRVSLRSINSGGLPTNQNVLLWFNGQVIAQEGVTIPQGQPLGRQDVMEFFDFQTYHRSAAGDRFMYAGDTVGDSNSDFMVMIDHVARLAEGSFVTFNPPPPFGPIATGTLNGIREMNMSSNADWYVRGGNSDGVDWVVRNALVIAATGRPIFTGSSESWSDLRDTATFFLHVGNHRGDYVVGGRTSAALNTDSVLVLNGQSVVARTSDAVDVNGDGHTNDDTFIAAFRTDRAVLNSEGWLLFVALLRTGAGADLGEALLKIRVLTPAPVCAGDVNGDGLVNAADLSVVLANFGGGGGGAETGDFNDDGYCNVADLSVLLSQFGGGC